MAPGAPPEGSGKSYQLHRLEGLEVFLPPGLIVSGPALVIRLAGFWRFRRLVVEGVANPSSCAL